MASPATPMNRGPKSGGHSRWRGAFPALLVLLPMSLAAASPPLRDGAASTARATNQADFDGDGIPDLAIGAPFEDIGAIENGGAVDILYGSPPGQQSRAVQLW